MPKLYTQEDFDNAIAAIKCGLSYRKASMQFGVPKSTLTDRIAGGKHKRQEQIFSLQEEEGFVEYFHQLSQRECGLTSLEVRNIIKCWLDRGHRIVSRFKDNMPTSNWVTQFKKRHPTLNIKPLKTVKQVKIKIEGKSEHLNDAYDEKVSPDSTQESLMEDDFSHKAINHDMPCEITSRSIPCSAMDETITTVVRPISPLVINHEILDSNERNFSSSSMEGTSPQSIGCQSSPPIVVHQNIETISLADSIKSISNKSLKSHHPLEAIANRNLNHPHESIEPRIVQPCSSSSMNNSNVSEINGTSSDMLTSKNYVALKALEDTLTDQEKNMFYRRFEEPHSLEIDVLYIAWKILKHRCANDESPTMVNCNMRYRKEYSPYLDKTTEHSPNPVAEETMLQLQEIISKYQDVDVRKCCEEDKYCRDDVKSSIVHFDGYCTENRKSTVPDIYKYKEEEDKKTSVIVANSINDV